jgi:hypothetical protein
MRLVLFAAILLTAACSASSSEIELAPDGSWTPVVEFKLDDSDFLQTMHWISGWSYALSTVATAQSQGPGPRLFCPTDRNTVESRVMLNILNSKFKGQRITSEQATAALWKGLREKYPCPGTRKR